ncbi:hypothetical protein WDU94_001413 [Cyamophila willieti]
MSIKTMICLILGLLVTTAHCISLPGVKNYLLTHNNPADLAALEYARLNITDEPVLEINDQPDVAVTSTSDDLVTIPTSIESLDEGSTTNVKQITLESSEASEMKDLNASELDSNVSKDSNGTDSDRLVQPGKEPLVQPANDGFVQQSNEQNSELRIKVPVNSYDETPQLPKLSSWFKPGSGSLENFSLFSKPKPLNLAPGSGIKTVYVRATKTIQQQPMCITVYGLKPPCSGTNQYNQGYYGYKSLDLEGESGADNHKDGQKEQTGTKSPVELRSFPSEPLLIFPNYANGSRVRRYANFYDDINEEEYANTEHDVSEEESPNDDFTDSAERSGRHLFRYHFAKSGDDKIVPSKVIPPHVVTETIYVTKLQPQYGAVTATLVVENCVPEIPTNYFHVPIPILHGNFPAVPNYSQISVPVIQPPTNLVSPSGESYKPVVLPALSPSTDNTAIPISPQKFPPTSLLQSHVPGFLNRFSSVAAAAHNGFEEINKFAHKMHQHKMSFLGGIKHPFSTYPKEDIEGSPSEIVEIGYKSDEDIKPVTEDRSEETSSDQIINEDSLNFKNSSSDLKTTNEDKNLDNSVKKEQNLNKGADYNSTDPVTVKSIKLSGKLIGDSTTLAGNPPTNITLADNLQTSTKEPREGNLIQQTQEKSNRTDNS